MQKLKYFIFALIPVTVLFAGTELFLRIFDFKYSDTVLEMKSVEAVNGVMDSTIQYNNRDGVIRFVKDANQLWVPADSFEKQTSVEKPEGTLRIATLGCSCTAMCYQTSKSYPVLLNEMLSDRAGPKVEVLNAAVGSYSSFQGLQRLKYTVLKYHPDILTVFFGWNDHWVTTVSDKNVRVRSTGEVQLLNVLEKFRIYQWLHYGISKVRGKMGSGPYARKRATLRVSLDDYAKNLNEIIDLTEKQGTKVLLITAPYDLTEFKPFSNFPFPREALEPIHKNYNNTVRKIAGERSVPLFDLAELVSKEPPGTILSSDGIHFGSEGCQWVAQKLYDRLHELSWL